VGPDPLNRRRVNGASKRRSVTRRISRQPSRTRIPRRSIGGGSSVGSGRGKQGGLACPESAQS